MKGTVGPAMLKIDLALAERFRRVCPHWAKYILELPSNAKTFTKNFRSGGRDWFMVLSDSCIVGDARANNAAHTKTGKIPHCGVCMEFSFNLMNFEGYMVGNISTTWNETLKRFLDHFEEAHSK